MQFYGRGWAVLEHIKLRNTCSITGFVIFLFIYFFLETHGRFPLIKGNSTMNQRNFVIFFLDFSLPSSRTSWRCPCPKKSSSAAEVEESGEEKDYKESTSSSSRRAQLGISLAVGLVASALVHDIKEPKDYIPDEGFHRWSACRQQQLNWTEAPRHGSVITTRRTKTRCTSEAILVLQCEIPALFVLSHVS